MQLGPEFLGQMRRERLQQDQEVAQHARRGLVSQVMASLTNTISAEMAVLKRMPSRSSVTFLMQACSALSCAGSAGRPGCAG